ncbi:MAG: DUF4127 family protein [Treponema sp.]|jgi:hypothetical protein|nr:DUF4127 family protein [Treponema sp.]
MPVPAAEQKNYPGPEGPSRISLLPLDSRPCNTRFPLTLARIAGEKLMLPDRLFMDYFTRPAWLPYIDEWLLEAARKSEYLILSLDMLCYGGLIASRGAGQAGAVSRLDIVPKLKALNPRLRIFAFSVIMRGSITTIDEKSRHYWELINEYSRLKGLGDPRYRELESRIPGELLDAYLGARKRNHLVNMGAVDLLNGNIIDCLILLQEDSSTGGIQQFEQKVLAERVTVEMADRLFIHNGADEGAMLLLGRILNEKSPPSIQWEFLNSGGKGMTAAYEDRPLIENLESQIRAAGMIPRDGDSSLRLLILSPKTAVQQNSQAQYGGTEDYTEVELDEMVSRIEAVLDAGKTAGLLDAAYANGGHLAFMQKIRERNLLGCLRFRGVFPRRIIHAYAGWNTASNSLGTVLSQLSALLRSRQIGVSPEMNSVFTLERYLDDCLYQSMVRPRIEARLKAEGRNVLNLGAAKNEVEGWIFKELKALAPELDFSFSLPWPRSFEGDIEIGGSPHPKYYA